MGVHRLKPHLALPLLGVAAYCGGWRRAAGIGGMMAAGWAAGCLLLGDPVRVSLGYLDYLGTAHKAIGFNRVTNDQVISWNRLVAAAGGPAFDLGLPAMAAGLAVAGAALWAVRVAGRPRPPAAVALAAGVAWGLLTVQVLGYDLVLLALTAPYLLHLHDRRRYLDLAVLGALLAVVSVPRGVVLAAAGGLPPDALGLALSYRTAALVAAALWLLVRDPPA